MPTAAALLLLFACAETPAPVSEQDTLAAVFGPSAQPAAVDGRGRFREIYCAVTEFRGPEQPGYMPCDEALQRLDAEPAPTGAPVELADVRNRTQVFIVFGFGFDCFAPLLHDEIPFVDHLSSLGYDVVAVPTEGLASGRRNAEILHETFLAEHNGAEASTVVVLGYSKGATDVLEALVTYPDLAAATDAVVSLTGSIRGSPLAVDATQSQANLLTWVPGSGCDESDGGVIEALRPDVRIGWLEANSIPDSVRYYSVITLPERERISRILSRAYRRLADIDPRNDGQLIFSDQVIPGSTVLGFVNADHWAIAVPVDRSRPLVAKTVIDENDFPREILAEAILRYVQEDLQSAGQARDALTNEDHGDTAVPVRSVLPARP